MEVNLIRDHRIAGVINKEITPETATLLGTAVGTYLKSKDCNVVATARDFSTASRMFKRAFSGGLLACGLEILDLHAAPTSVLQFVVRRFGAEAGISFSGRHNDFNVTGIRLFDGNGVELSTSVTQEIYKIYQTKKFRLANTNDIGWVSPIDDTDEIYKRSIKGAFGNGPIKQAKFRLVIDCALGPMSETVPTLLAARQFKVDVVALNAYRPHGIPTVLPSTDSLEKLMGTVVATNSDLGVAFDCEGNQTVFIDEKGNLITGDDISCLLLQNYDKGGTREKTVIGSASLTKRAEESLPEKTSLVRVSDTPGSIASVIRDKRAAFGVSDRGVYFFPAWGSENDGIYSLFVILELMASTGETLSNLMRNLPQTTTYQQEIKIDSPAIVERIFKELWKHERVKAIDTLLGEKIIFDDGWVHVIPSYQTSSFTLIAEVNEDESCIAGLFNTTRTILKDIEDNYRPILNGI
ncbi:MAG: hypothetical protein ACTSRU_11375 [Candidatus Hodarchaeales archaeon]